MALFGIIIFSIVFSTVNCKKIKIITFNDSIAAATDEEWDEKNSTDPLVLQMRYFESKFLESIGVGVGDTNSNLEMIENFRKFNLSDNCLISFGFIMDALSQFEPWAMKSKLCHSFLYQILKKVDRIFLTHIRYAFLVEFK
jgi:hypothetical protein